MLNQNIFGFSSLTQLRLSVAIASLFFSVIVILTDDLINSDGILYVEMAKAFLESGLNGTSRLFDWPFYAILGSIVSKITSLSALNSLYFINIVFFVALTDSLVLISSRLLPNIRLTTIASVLLVSFFTLNEYREYVIRDIGYWALSFAAIYQFILFLEKNNFYSLLLWQTLTITAFLFRIEAIVMLLVLPLIIFSDLKTYGLKRLLQAYSLISILIITTILIALIQAGFSTSPFAKVFEIFRYLNFENLSQTLNDSAQVIDKEIIARVARDKEQGIVVLLSGFLGLISVELIAGLSIGYLLIAAISAKTQPEASDALVSRLLIFALLIQIVILYVFVLKAHFMSTRYCIMAIVLLLLLLLPKMSKFIDNCIVRKSRLSLILVSLAIVFSVGDAIHYTNSKKYIQHASIWAGDNLDDDKKIFTNSQFIRFYIGENNTNLTVDFNDHLSKNHRYDYLLIDTREKTPKLKNQMSKMELHELHVFGRKHQVLIYKIDHAL